MSKHLTALCDKLAAKFAGNDTITVSLDLVEMHVKAEDLIEVATQLRDDPELAFVQMSDLAGVDYATYGKAEWSTATESQASFSRAVDSNSIGRLSFGSGMEIPELSRPRFASVMHLLSLDHNVRLRIICPAPDDELPVVPSVTGIWACADWYERESFDLYGILYDGHNDLRHIELWSAASCRARCSSSGVGNGRRGRRTSRPTHWVVTPWYREISRE